MGMKNGRKRIVQSTGVPVYTQDGPKNVNAFRYKTTMRDRQKVGVLSRLCLLEAGQPVTVNRVTAHISVHSEGVHHFVTLLIEKCIYWKM